MPDDLIPVAPADLVQALAYALSHRNGRASHRHDTLAYRLAAEALVEHLTSSRYVIMRRPPPTEAPAMDWAPKAQREP